MLSEAGHLGLSTSDLSENSREKHQNPMVSIGLSSFSHSNWQFCGVCHIFRQTRACAKNMFAHKTCDSNAGHCNHMNRLLTPFNHLHLFPCLLDLGLLYRTRPVPNILFF